MVRGELCIDCATFSLYLRRKAIQAQANPAVESFLLQPCTAGAGASGISPAWGVLALCRQLLAPWSGTGLAWGPARASKLGETGGEQPG